MQVTPQITFRNMEPSAALEAAINEKMDKLDQFYDQIIKCHVMIEAPHRHHHQGNLYSVHIDITLPQGKVVVSRDPQRNHTHEDAYVALRDAFKAAYRQLEDYQRRQRGDVKEHVMPASGKVVTLLPTKEYGFIRTADGREVFFHKKSVLGDAFDKLELGSEVRFDEEMGEKGPQASSVHLIGKHHILPE
jgi:ribosomal subunit interface protein